VYVRLHNRGTQTATDVQVKLHWAFAGAGLPALPADFWPAFPANSTDVSIWHPMPAQTIPSLSYSGASVAGSSNDNSVVLSFDFPAPVYNASLNNPDHFCLFLVVTAPDDPISTVSAGSQVPDLITPSDNNVTQKNVHLIDSGNSSGLRSQLIVSNPFDYPINTRLVAWRPKDWNVESNGIELGKLIELGAKESMPVGISMISDGQPSASINIVQLYQASDMKAERILGGITFIVAPSAQPAVVPSPGFIENVGVQEKLIAEYLKLVADTISKPDARSEDRTLLHRLGILIEEQSKLLAGVDAARKDSRSDH
jgi:hypothetical protein